MTKQLIVSPAPHVKDGITTQKVMLNVLIALVPAAVVSVLVFGLRALVLEVVCVASCVFFEYIFRLICKKDCTISDLSAAVTGLILAFNLPASLPIWMAVVGAFVAIVIAKQMFGGIGGNFANPAITGRIFLLLSFGKAMTTWPTAWTYLPGTVDTVSGATPLALMAEGSAELPSYLNMFLGVRGGCLGETCTLALLIGGIYLIARRIITPTIPLVYLATIALMSLATGMDPLYELMAGGAMLAAFFMLTDYSTSPATESGKAIFALLAGIITMLIRVYGSYPEGASFAILLMNILAPHIDNLTRRKPFGGAAK